MPTLSTIDKTVLKETHHSAKRISLFPENFKTGLWKNLNLIFVVRNLTMSIIPTQVCYQKTQMLTTNILVGSL